MRILEFISSSFVSSSVVQQHHLPLSDKMAAAVVMKINHANLTYWKHIISGCRNHIFAGRLFWYRDVCAEFESKDTWL